MISCWGICIALLAYMQLLSCKLDITARELVPTLQVETLWELNNPFIGITHQKSFIIDIYIIIHNNSNIAIRSSKEKNTLIGSRHTMSNCVQGSQR